MSSGTSSDEDVSPRSQRHARRRRAGDAMTGGPGTAYLVNEAGTIVDVLRALEQGAVGVALITSDDGRLVGVLTDGDARRAILAGCSLDAAVLPHVNRKFTAVAT